MGFFNKYLFIAESMGPSLNELVEFYDNEIDIISTINIAINLIEKIRIIQHSDITCSNICYANNFSKKNSMIRKLCIIDFGNSITFKEKNKFAHELNDAKPLCTREYASLNVLIGTTSSRRDDLESILLVIIKTYTKKLPWES